MLGITRFLPSFYYLSIAIYIVGALLRLQHWPYGREVLMLATVCFLLFFLAVTLEILFSKKAESRQKVLWACVYVAAPAAALYAGFWTALAFILLAGCYMRFIRPRMLFTREESADAQFDIFKDRPSGDGDAHK